MLNEDLPEDKQPRH